MAIQRTWQRYHAPAGIGSKPYKERRKNSRGWAGNSERKEANEVPKEVKKPGVYVQALWEAG